MAEEIEYPDSFLSAGISASQFISRPAEWINRRVETVWLLSHEETRRQVSIDFTLSEQERRELRIEDGVIVPISVMTKEARRNFDLRDEAGASVPVLGKRSNGALAHVAVMNQAYDASPIQPDQDEFDLVWTELREVVISEPKDGIEALSDFVDKVERGEGVLRKNIWEHPTCRRTLETLQDNYVLFAVIRPQCADRRILKYSFSEDFKFDLDLEDASALPDGLDLSLKDRLSRPGRKSFQVPCPGAWQAESFHLEIVIPEELRIDRAVLCDFQQRGLLSAFDRNRNRSSLYPVRTVTSDQEVVAYVVLGPERRGRIVQAAITGVVVSVLIWLGVASGLEFENPDAPGASASIVLAGAAIYSGITAGRGESTLVSQVFTTPRFLLLFVSLCALGASAALAMEIPTAKPLVVWWIAAGLATFASLWLVWLASRAPGNLKRASSATTDELSP